jgi:hypothetical protein
VRSTITRTFVWGLVAAGDLGDGPAVRLESLTYRSLKTCSVADAMMEGLN